MGHEPLALVGNAEHPMKLMGTYAFFAGTKQMESHEPLVQWDMAVLEDRPYGRTKLFPAGTRKQAWILPGSRVRGSRTIRIRNPVAVPH